MCEVVDGVDDLLQAVRHRFRTGASAIKLMTSGGVVSPVDPIRVPQYSAEEVRVVTEEASRRGSYATAHAYSPEAIRHSVLNGVRCIEHGNLLDAETARLMADNDVYLVPTLVTYEAMDRRGEEVGLTKVGAAKNREVLEAGRNAVALARDAGVRIGFGTDLMGELEDEQLAGLRLQCEVLGVHGALRSATSTNAALLRRGDLGRIAQGPARTWWCWTVIPSTNPRSSGTKAGRVPSLRTGRSSPPVPFGARRTCREQPIHIHGLRSVAAQDIIG